MLSLIAIIALVVMFKYADQIGHVVYGIFEPALPTESFKSTPKPVPPKPSARIAHIANGCIYDNTGVYKITAIESITRSAFTPSNYYVKFVSGQGLSLTNDKHSTTNSYLDQSVLVTTWLNSTSN